MLPGVAKKIQIKNKGWHNTIWASQVVLVVKDMPGSAGDTSNTSSIPGSGRPLEEGHSRGHHSSIPAWRIPGTEEPGGLQYLGLQRVVYD